MAIFLNNIPQQLFFAQIEQSSQIIMLILPYIVKQSIMIVLHNAQTIAYMQKLIFINLRHLLGHIFLLNHYRLRQKFMLLDGIDTPSLILILDQQTTDEVAARN
jgi:hypothetical protein